MPSPEIFAPGTGMTTPDRGVSIESGVHPNAVCHASYYLPGGSIGVVNLYSFMDATVADVGYQYLAGRAAVVNADLDTPPEPASIDYQLLHADALYARCHHRGNDTICMVVARYAHHVYWLSVSHLDASDFDQEDLSRVLEEIEAKLTSRG